MPRPCSILIALWAVLGAAVASADPAKTREITGIVVDAATGAPVGDAVVVTGDGEPVLTNSAGRFTIRVDGRVNARPQVLVTAAGFGDRTVAIRSGAGKADRPVRIELTLSDDAEIIELEGVAPDLGPATWDLSVDQIRALPGAGNDVLKAVQSLPGVARIPFGLGGLVIRGQSPRDTNVYLDGIEVPLAFHFFGLASFYPASMLDSLEVTNGGHGVEHGRGQGGLVTLASKAPRRDGWGGGGEVSVLDAQAHAEGPTGVGAISVGVRRSYIDGILRAVLPADERFLPRYYDSQIRWDAGDARKRGVVSLWLFTSNDRMSDDRTSFTEAFVRIGARYQRQRGATTISITPWAGRDVLSFEAEADPELGEEAAEMSRTQWPVGLRASVTRDARWGHLTAGLDVQGGRFGRIAFGESDEMDEDLPDPLTPHVARWSADIGAWVEGRYKVDGDKLVLRPGLRLERYGLSDEIVLDPRLQVSHTLSPKLVVRESIGLYHQPPTAADTDPDFGNPALDSAYTLQTSAGVETVGPLGIEIGATVFFNRGFHQATAVTPPSGTEFDSPAGPGSGIGAVMLELLEEQLGSFEYRDNVGQSASYGVELGVKHQVGRFLGWGSYTLTKARRMDDPMRFEGWRAYQLDQLHNLSMVGSVLVGKWQLGARFRLVTGNPYTPINGLTNDGSEIKGPALSRRLPDFIQVDLRADREWKRGWGTLKFFLDVQHATWFLRKNVEDAGWDYETDRPSFTPGLPILPLIGLEYIADRRPPR